MKWVFIVFVVLLFLASCSSTKEFPKDVTGEYSKETLKLLREGYSDCLNRFGWKNEEYCVCLHDVRAFKRVGSCDYKFIE